VASAELVTASRGRVGGDRPPALAPSGYARGDGDLPARQLALVDQDRPLGPARTVGIDSSQALVELAPSSTPEHEGTIGHLRHDATQVYPFQVKAADVIHCRLLRASGLAELSSSPAVARSPGRSVRACSSVPGPLPAARHVLSAGSGEGLGR
jgi:hypothetical protein